MAPSRHQPEANRVSHVRRRAESETSGSTSPELPAVRGELVQIRKRIVGFFRARPGPKAKPASTVSACGASFAPSVMRQLEAGHLLAVHFGAAVFAIPRERHAAARAVILASKTRKITRDEAVATLTVLARG
jgi:hypothetical protein